MAEATRLPERDPAAGKSKSSLPPAGGPPYGVDMEARLAVLEQIAASTRDALVEIKNDIRDLRTEMKAEIREIRIEINEFKKEVKDEFQKIREEMKEVRQEHRTDYRLIWGALIAASLGLAGMIGGLGAIMAHGFKWF